jgi:hypothetical protein
MTPPPNAPSAPIAPRPVAPGWTVALPFTLLAMAIASAGLSWQDGDASFYAFSAVALALDVAVVITAMRGRRAARAMGATPRDAAMGAVVAALLMIVGFGLLMLILTLKPVVK